MALSDFLERIRLADETTKRLWVAVGTLFAMTLVVALWFSFFGGLGLGDSANPAAASDKFSFAESVRGMIATVGQMITNFFRSVGDIISQPKQYIISPPNQ
ncbi:MAG: hypothetical protein AAB759_02120 [Patescibacteria group bacterium]